jgi:hypothetical protein
MNHIKISHSIVVVFAVAHSENESTTEKKKSREISLINRKKTRVFKHSLNDYKGIHKLIILFIPLNNSF